MRPTSGFMSRAAALGKANMGQALLSKCTLKPYAQSNGLRDDHASIMQKAPLRAAAVVFTSRIRIRIIGPVSL